MNIRNRYEGPEMEFARSVKAGILGAIVVGVLLIAAGTQGGAGVVAEATASAPAGQAYVDGFFPFQFPAPEGTPEPHIEAF